MNSIQSPKIQENTRRNELSLVDIGERFHWGRNSGRHVLNQIPVMM